MKKPSELFKKIGLALAGLATVVSGSAMADIQIQTHGGLKVFDPNNPSYWFKLNGRMEFDETLFSGTFRDRGTNFPSSGNVRRAFLAFNGGLGDCFNYNLTLDFGRSQGNWQPVDANGNVTNDNRGPNARLNGVTHGLVAVEEAWLGYTGLCDNIRFRFGQFTPVTTLDGYANYGTGNGQMFLESALATRAFSVPSYVDMDTRAMKGYGVIMDSHFYDTFTVAATVYQPAHGPNNVYGNAQRSDRLGEALRLTYSPIHDCDTAIHVGLMARHQALNHTNATFPEGDPRRAIRNTLFFTTPEVTPRNTVGNPRNFSAVTAGDPNLIDAGAIRAKSYDHLAGELAGIWGPWTAAGEYHHTHVRRKQDGSTPVGGRLSFNGWHAQAGYVLTGETRGYNFQRGTIEGIEPCGPFGAWEVVARYSQVSLNKKDVFGGSGRNVTAGLNWYVNNNIRVAFNYIRANIRPTGAIAGTATFAPTSSGVRRKLDIVAARLQVVF